MGKERVMAFSDGVVAIIITIMVLELKVPHGHDLAALSGLLPVFLSYVLSFLYVAIYWHNHHHLYSTVEKVNGSVLWANTHLLFWLSLIPFATAWMDESHFEAAPMAVYGIVLLMAAIAYWILQTVLIRCHGSEHPLKRMIGSDTKGKLSPVFYVAGILLALFGWPAIAGGIYVVVALMWLVPDRRIEHPFVSTE